MSEDYYEYCQETGEVGCCLLCVEAHDGCLCFNCKCTKCEHYDEEEKCTIALDNGSNNYNLQVIIDPNRWITIKFNGAIYKDDYAKIKQFIQSHFHWDKEFEEYWKDYEYDFAQQLVSKLKSNGFYNISENPH